VPKIWGGKYRGQTQKWFLLRFTGEDSDIDIETEHPEFLDWKWVPLADLPKLIVPFKRKLYEDLLLEFGPAIRAWRR
jgi:putative (di)nucleoside polyphosphate hydrolase